MIPGYCFSKNWKQTETETTEEFNKKTKLLWGEYLSDINYKGFPFIWRNKILYTKELKVSDILQMRKERFSFNDTDNCPLCDKRCMIKIIDPKFQEGFIDKGGVWHKCVCVLGRYIEVPKNDSRANILRFMGLNIKSTRHYEEIGLSFGEVEATAKRRHKKNGFDFE